jgi:spore coat polysaccharide biosynthesis protein SpsF
MIGCIIQARMGSKRLPGKVMLKIDKKNPVIHYTLEQIKHCKYLDDIAVATTNLKEDDVIAEFGKNYGINLFRGNSTDVLDRYYECAKKFSYSKIVRITSDNPLIDPLIIDKIIKKFISNKFDYVSNTIERTFPYGTEVEIFSFSALEKAWKNSKNDYEREHVTPYIYDKYNQFKISNFSFHTNLSRLRWTLDTKEDLKMIKTIVKKIEQRPIFLKDILWILKNEPTLMNINQNTPIDDNFLNSFKFLGKVS